MAPCNGRIPARVHIADRARKHARVHRLQSRVPTGPQFDIPIGAVARTPRQPAQLERITAPAAAQCSAQSCTRSGIDWLAREASYGTTLTGLYPDSPRPSIARQRYHQPFTNL